MTLRVALISTAWKPVPPNGYGGIENVVYDLITGSKDLDVSFDLFTIKESIDIGKIPQDVNVHWFFEKSMYPEIGNEATKAWVYETHALAAWDMVTRGNFDIIHDHTEVGFGTIAAANPARAPLLMTLHGPLEMPYMQHYFRSLNQKENMYFNSISFAQRRPLPDLNFIGNVYNGLNPEYVPFNPENNKFLLIIGRIAPFKGQREAIEVARALGMNLVIAGSVETSPISTNYWREEIETRLDRNLDGSSDKIEALRDQLSQDNGQIIYFGEADVKEKFELFKNAQATLMPISWEEPFGLVMIESLATGTPVVAFKRGSVPEIIVDGENGFIVETTAEMTQALMNISQISRIACRETVKNKFSNEVMARSYFELYKEIVAQRVPKLALVQ